jgi:hypothetical protein
MNYDIDLMKSKLYPVQYEVLTVASMKNTAFCDVISRTLVEFHRRFGRTNYFLLQCQRICRVQLAAF